jgi:hypothetical protein
MCGAKQSTRRLIGCLLPPLLSSCASLPYVSSDLPNGDHVVTTYVRNDADSARAENLWAAKNACHGSVALINEQQGADAGGVWTRLFYGCLADGPSGPSGAAATDGSSRP